MKACLDCGTAISKAARRCQTCYHAIAALPPPTCADCGGLRRTRQSIRCAPCNRRHKGAGKLCQDCGGRKSAANSARCLACARRRIAARLIEIDQVAIAFSPEWLRRQLDRSDLDWTVQQLADAAGIGKTTLHAWLRGSFVPRRSELAAVMAVLAFERCAECGGSGYVDPAERREGRPRRTE